MKTTQSIAIVGAGFAGLTLALLLSNRRLKHTRVTIIDPYFDDISRKTLCFWGQIPCVLSPFIQKTWHEVEVRTKEASLRSTLNRNPYHRIHEQAFLTQSLDVCRNHPSFSTHTARVLQLNCARGGKKAEVITSNGSMQFDWVFSSRPENSTRPRLLQHFGGWEVYSETPCFRESCMTLMDFDTPQRDSSAFYYILPNSPRSALVEYTQISADKSKHEVYDNAIRRFLEKCGARNWHIQRTEYGAIPMDTRFEFTSRPRVVLIGRAGGLTKPSTGYTVSRTIRHLRHIVLGLEQRGAPLAPPRAPTRFRWYDEQFLQMLGQSPNRGAQIFGRLLTRNRVDDVFDFLAEKTHLLQELRLFWALPWLPFIKQALLGR